MEIALTKKNNTEGLIKIKLTETDYQLQVDEKMKEYAKRANLKGFRPGKVPMPVIKRMFGQSILVEEINQLLSKKLSEYIKTNKINLIGEPLPVVEKAQAINWETQRTFEFEYEIGMVDDFSVELSSKVKIKSYPIEVSESVIDETITDLRKRFGKVNYPEISEASDNLIGTLRSTEDESFMHESAYLAIEKVEKKEQKKFIGLKKGDVVEFDIQKIFGSKDDLAQLLSKSVDEVSTAKGKFTLTVNTISRAELAEINQELFDRVFGKDVVTTEEEFRSKVNETVGNNYKRETEYFLEHHIQDHFLKQTKIEIPQEFLKNWLKVTGGGKITDDVLTKEFDTYLRDLKWDLIKNKIAEENKINIEADEVKGRAREMIITQFGGPAIAEQLHDKLDAITDNYLSHENGQNFMRLYNQLRHEKIMKLIKDTISVDEKKVSVDEFKKIVEEHQH